MDMPRGSKQARDWHHANQGGINYFLIIQYCLHAEAQGITASIPHSVFLTRLQWGSSSAHLSALQPQVQDSSIISGYLQSKVFRRYFSPKALLHKNTVIIFLLKSCYRDICNLNGLLRALPKRLFA